MSESQRRPELKQSHWQSMGPELWGQVFRSYKQPIKDEDVDIQRKLVERASPWLYTLQLVCKRFAETFAQHPELFCDLGLEDREGEHVAGVLRWVHRHADHVQNFTTRSTSSSVVNPVLAALYARGAFLLRVVNDSIDDAHVGMLSMFASITTCILTWPEPDGSEICSLKPLQGLPCLTNLVLVGGTFTEVDAPLHLTSLALAHCEAYFCGEPLSSLRRINLTGTQCHGFHLQGLAACSHLQSVKCVNTYMNGGPTDGFSFLFPSEVRHLANQLATLTDLTSLCVGGDSPMNGEPIDGFELGWLSRLTALQSLFVVADAGVPSVVFPSTFSAVSRLTSLHIACRKDTKTELQISFDWKLMKMLESVKLEGFLRCTRNLSSLVALEALKEVKLVGAQVSFESTYEVIRLATRLAQEKPSVVLQLT